MHILNIESGMNVIQQSHRNKITNISMNNFIRFAKQYNICLDEEKEDDFVPIPISDVYNEGILSLKHNFTNRKGGLDRLKPAYLFDPETQNTDYGNSSSSGDSSDSNDSDYSETSHRSNNSTESNNSTNSNISNASSISDGSEESSKFLLLFL